MKTLSKSISLTLILVLSSQAWAQKLSMKAKYNESKSRIVVDAAPILVKGVGLSYGYAITRNMVVGPRFSFFNIQSETSPYLDSKVLTLGAEGRYFFKGEKSNSFYGLGGVVAASAESQAHFEGTTAGSAKASSVGPLLGFGYQAIPAGMGTENILFNIGAIYGHGYQVGGTARSFNRGPTTVSDVTISNSLYLEASAGMTF